MQSFHGVCSFFHVDLDPIKVLTFWHNFAFSKISSSYIGLEEYVVVKVELVGHDLLVVLRSGIPLDNYINEDGETHILI